MGRSYCNPPQSITNVYNNTIAASQIGNDSLAVSAGLTVQLTNIPVQGFFLGFLDRVLQDEGGNFTVDYATGLVTLIGATVGQNFRAVYIVS